MRRFATMEGLSRALVFIIGMAILRDFAKGSLTRPIVYWPFSIGFGLLLMLLYDWMMGRKPFGTIRKRFGRNRQHSPNAPAAPAERGLPPFIVSLGLHPTTGTDQSMRLGAQISEVTQPVHIQQIWFMIDRLEYRAMGTPQDIQPDGKSSVFAFLADAPSGMPVTLCVRVGKGVGKVYHNQTTTP